MRLGEVASDPGKSIVEQVAEAAEAGRDLGLGLRVYPDPCSGLLRGLQRRAPERGLSDSGLAADDRRARAVCETVQGTRVSARLRVAPYQLEPGRCHHTAIVPLNLAFFSMRRRNCWGSLDARLAGTGDRGRESATYEEETMHHLLITVLESVAAAAVGVTVAVARDGSLPPGSRAYERPWLAITASPSAEKDGYWIRPGEPCVASPGGTMGIHTIALALLADDALDSAQPEILLYVPKGRRRPRAGRG